MDTKIEVWFPPAMCFAVLLSIVLTLAALVIGTLGDEYGSPPWDQAGAWASSAR
jgi:hypothetical protein